MLILCLIWANLVYGSAALLNPSSESKDVKAYPAEWLQKCGDDNGQIPIFKQKAKEFESCYMQFVDPTLLIEGFMESMSNNKVAEFAEEKCQEMPEINGCLDAYASSIAHCFNKKEQTDMETTVKILKATLDFICERDGEKILIFLQDKGLECYESKQSELHACINDTSKDDFTNATMPDDLSFIASVSYTPSTCQTIDEIYVCFFETLKGCTDTTPSLLLEAMNLWILKDTPCREEGTAFRAQLGTALSSSYVFLLFVVFNFLMN